VTQVKFLVCGFYSDYNTPDELAVCMSLDYTEEEDRNVHRKDGT